MNDINDPYKFLALYIVSHYGIKDIQQALSNRDWLRKQMQYDCIHMDLAGPFVDAVMQDLADHDKIWLRGQLKELGAALFTKLDVERLRNNISEIVVMP